MDAHDRALRALHGLPEPEQRAALAALVPLVGPRARIELVFLDLRAGRELPARLAEAQAIADAAPPGALVKARALHVIGIAHGKLRQSEAAIAALLSAQDLYRSLESIQGRAEVHDTLGSVHAATGRADLALGEYALSLVGKLATGDEHGQAITLGNLGRLHLRAGRFEAALECFEWDAKLCERLGDARGSVRMLEDRGRVHLVASAYSDAEPLLVAAYERALAEGFQDLAIFALKDLGELRLRQQQLTRAEECLRTARALADSAALSVVGLHLDGLAARISVASGDPSGLDLLDRAITAFAANDLYDEEIVARIEAAQHAVRAGAASRAREHLERALDRARAADHLGHVRRIRELFEELGLRADMAEQRGRWTTEPEEPLPDRHYIRLRSLGHGGFGEVFEAYDPEQRRVVALKCLRLERLFDVEKRRALLRSARMELDATREVDHPLVARVHAIGKDERGGTYIVQDLVRGEPLRKLMELGKPPSAEALRLLARVADGLAALHDAHVVHRDLKPENVIVRERDGLPVLVDFGIAHVGGDLARAEGLAGTWAYLAPERRAGGPGGFASDVYALGIIAREWLLKEDPRGASGTAFVIPMDEPRGARVEPAQYAGSPNELSRFLAELTDDDPFRRPSARDAAARLDDLADRAPI